MLTYTHLFWDFDGTLYNSYPQIVCALESTLRDLQVPETLWENNLALLKGSVFEALGVYEKKCGLARETLMERFQANHARAGFFPPYEGLKDCLTRLKEAGACHYLYTHRDTLAWKHLERDGCKELFSGGVTSEDGFPYKPAPDALLSMIRQYRLDSQDCAMIGDRDIDVQSGRNAGIAGILFDPEGFFPDLDADKCAVSMEELYSLLNPS